MKKTTNRKLALNVQTLRQLDASRLELVAGGGVMQTIVSNNVQCQMESVMASCANCL